MTNAELMSQPIPYLVCAYMENSLIWETNICQSLSEQGELIMQYLLSKLSQATE